MTFNPLSWFETEVAMVEADIQKIVAAIVNDSEVAIADLEKGLSWLSQQTPAIANGLKELETFVAAVLPALPGGATVNLVQSALAEANVAMTGLQTFATTYNTATTGGGVTATQAAEAVVAGYHALTTAQAAVSTANATTTGAAKAVVQS